MSRYIWCLDIFYVKKYMMSRYIKCPNMCFVLICVMSRYIWCPDIPYVQIDLVKHLYLVCSWQLALFSNSYCETKYLGKLHFRNICTRSPLNCKLNINETSKPANQQTRPVCWRLEAGLMLEQVSALLFGSVTTEYRLLFIQSYSYWRDKKIHV